ncbi:hypothetical protein EXIGLDRAFT_766451 [Exidia glandulosa HHB12029]|uniref:Uncharacterized protein n=1 Tax=Exidia glandulosa HHB12029 TaxID=1314781 RepID=A0A165JQD5_EXIGL|nr:hypothetical protein EXIGLDRAFT_766451 [Exidia glandulosa HHB12029]
MPLTFLLRAPSPPPYDRRHKGYGTSSPRPRDIVSTVAGRVLRRSPAALLMLLVPCALLIYVFTHPVRSLSLARTSISQKIMAMHAPSLAPSTATPSRILLVSAYFPLNKSKHSQFEYHKWLLNFVGQVKTDMYVFVPPEMEEVIQDMREDLPIYINTTYSSISDLPPLSPLQDSFNAQHYIDPEAAKRSAELYMIWAAKPYFVREAIQNVKLAGYGVDYQENGGNYDYVFWIDAGSMREPHAFVDWPNFDKVEQIWNNGSRLTGTPAEDLILIPLEHPIPKRFAAWEERDGPIDAGDKTSSSEGSLFGGKPKALEWWLDAYFSYMRYYLSEGHFIGNDQSIMNALFMLYPERFITVWNRDPRAPSSPGLSHYGGLGYCGDPWYYYISWMGKDVERKRMNAIRRSNPGGDRRSSPHLW